LSVVSVVCFQVEVSATDWSLVQRSSTDFGASLCVWSRYLENEEAKSRYGAVKNTTTMGCNAKKINNKQTNNNMPHLSYTEICRGVTDVADRGDVTFLLSYLLFLVLCIMHH
jgi:hypothetical protein